MSNGPPVSMPPNFADTWEASDSAVECARTLGISLDHAWLLHQRLKKEGVKLKRMPKNRPRFDHASFAAAWNAALSVGEVAQQLGLTAEQTRDRARRVRRAGVDLKRMARTINVHGVEMTVMEFCRMTGQSKSTVMERLGRGLSPFRAARQGTHTQDRSAP